MNSNNHYDKYKKERKKLLNRVISEAKEIKNELETEIRIAKDLMKNGSMIGIMRALLKPEDVVSDEQEQKIINEYIKNQKEPEKSENTNDEDRLFDLGKLNKEVDSAPKWGEVQNDNSVDVKLIS